MADLPREHSMERSVPASVQLTLPIASPAREGIAPLALQEADGEWEIVAPETLIEVQQRLEIIQTLISAQGTERYGKLQQKAAKKLGMSVRSLQRLVKR